MTPEAQANPLGMLAVLGADPERFCAKYSLRAGASAKCGTCGTLRVVDVPARGPKGRVGLLSWCASCKTHQGAPYSVALDDHLSPDGVAE